MDRSLATAELPLLNRDEEYVSDANRTFEDDNPISIPISERLYKRVHLSDSRFKMIYRDTIRFFTKMEKHSYIGYLTGEKDKNEFKRDLENYLRRNFPDICKYDSEKEIEDENGNKRTIIVNPDLEEIMKRIRQSLFGYDVLQPLIDNEETTDIKICSPYDIRVRIKGKAYQSDAHFIDEMDEYRFIEGLVLRNGLNFGREPVLTFTDAHDKNYLLRFTVSSPVVTTPGYPYLHIRKVAKVKKTFDDLITAGMLNDKIKRYLIDRAKTSRCVVFAGPPGCVDRDTEFFNGKEWKSIAEYKEGEKVLQFDPKTNEATLVNPIAYIKKPCDKMYHFETKYGIDQTLSPEHRVLFYKRKKKDGKKYWDNEVQEIIAEELKNLQNSGHFYGGFKTDFKYSGAGINLSDDEIRLMLAVICDGHFDNRENLQDRCTVRLKKERKINEIEDILLALNINYTKRIEEKTGYTIFRFIPPRQEKVFSSDWYNCTQKQLKLICDNILKWDGTITQGRMSFSTTVKENADFVQFAFSACGYRATFYVSHRAGTEYLTNGKKYIRKNEEYSVIMCDKTIIGMAWHNDGRDNNVTLKEVKPEDGYKYCFTVPTHALVLRRNGKIFITGNSGKSTALNAFIEYIPRTRETLVIQENDELFTEQSGFMFKHVTHGFHGEPICTLEDLGRMALVEGCNEFVIGEVKGGEMRAAATLLNAGGYGAYTIHSNNAYEVLPKSADLVKYGSDYSFDEAKRMLKSIDTIVYMDGYKIREILEVTGYDDEKHDYNYVHIYKYGI